MYWFILFILNHQLQFRLHLNQQLLDQLHPNQQLLDQQQPSHQVWHVLINTSFNYSLLYFFLTFIFPIFHQPISVLSAVQNHALLMQSILNVVQLVSPPVWNPPPTVLAPVSVAASANQGSSSRDGAVCHWRNVAVWMTRITIMRSDVLDNIPICIHCCLVKIYNGKTVNDKKVVQSCYTRYFLPILILCPILF